MNQPAIMAAQKKFLTKLSPNAQQKLNDEAYFIKAEANRAVWLDFFSVNKLNTPLPEIRQE